MRLWPTPGQLCLGLASVAWVIAHNIARDPVATAKAVWHVVSGKPGTWV